MPGPGTIRHLIESTRLSIRAPAVQYAEELNAAIVESIDSLRPWMPWAASVPFVDETRASLAEAARRFDLGEDLRLLLFLRNTDTLVGSSGLHRIDWDVPRFEIGYWVRDSYSGRGLITEAVKTIADFAFGDLGARRVEIYTSMTNRKSMAVADRAGFHREALLHNHRRDPDGTVGHTVVYCRLSNGE